MAVSPATRGKEKTTACLESSRHIHEQKNKKNHGTRAKHAQMVKLKNPLISFFAKSAVSQMPVAVTLGICFFFYPCERYKKNIGIEYKKRGNFKAQI